MSVDRSLRALGDARYDIDQAVRELRPTVALQKPGDLLTPSQKYILKHVAAGLMVGGVFLLVYGWSKKYLAHRVAGERRSRAARALDVIRHR